MPCTNDWADNNDLSVAVDFVDLLACIIRKFRLKVSSLECMQLNDTAYVSYNGVYAGEQLFGVEWVVGDECGSAGSAEQNIVKKTIDLLRRSLGFDVNDDNYTALPLLRIKCHLVIESCLAVRERCNCLCARLGNYEQLEKGPIISVRTLNELAHV